MSEKRNFALIRLGRRKFMAWLGLVFPGVLLGFKPGAAQDLPPGQGNLSTESDLASVYASQDEIWWTPTPAVDAMTAIRTRRSVRAFRNRSVEAQLVQEVIAAGTSAPSANNEQPWHFVVVDDPALLQQIGRISPGTVYVGKAPLAILVCGENRYECWLHDTAACAQNMLLAAHALGLGAVWTGAYPDNIRETAYRNMFKLPTEVTPLCLVVLGYPQGVPEPQNRLNEARVHNNTW